MNERAEQLRSPGRVGRPARATPALLACLLALAGLAGALAARAGAVVTLPGVPLSVSIGPLGQCQSHYASTANDFSPRANALGDCGFFLAFPKAGNPAAVAAKVYGFAGTNGPGLGASEYTPVSPGSVTGAGSSSDPYKLVTTFKLSDPESKLDYALIAETTTYVDGDAQFTSSFDVENVTGQAVAGLNPQPSAQALRFHAIYAGDLQTGGSDFGSGLLLPGPPRFVGGQNEADGVLGGLVEAGPPSPPWSDYQVGCWDVVPEPFGACPATSPADHGVWAAVRAAASEGKVFNDDIDANLIDNAVGVSWDDNLANGLAPGAHAFYSIVNRAEIPAALDVAQATQTRSVEEVATIAVTAKDTAGVPYANRPFVYSTGGANPKTGSVLTDASGVATIRYVGTVAGSDTMQMFLDLAGTGVQAPQDPSATAQVAWTLGPATAASANSVYRVRSIRVGADGTIRIAFVPLQDGTATLEVIAPTAAISRLGGAARSRCRRAQVRIKGRCRPASALVGVASQRARASALTSIAVRPSSRVRKALAKGRTVQLTARLTYKSRLGGKLSRRVFQLKVKGKRKHH
jgi:hypothetical protein